MQHSIHHCKIAMNFSLDLDDSLSAHPEAVLGPEETSQLQLHSREEEKVCRVEVWKIVRTGDCQYLLLP